MLKAKVEPTIYTPIIDSIFSQDPWGAPVGRFYLLFEGRTVPTTTRPTIISIENDRVNEPLEIEVIYKDSPPDVGVLNKDKPTVINVISEGENFTVPIQLGPGRNDITIRTRTLPVEVTYLIVYANEIVSLWEAFARDFYTNVTKIIETEKNAINSPFGIRLVEPFLSTQELLPDTQSLKVLTARMLVRGLLHSVGNQSGEMDILKALSVNTPALSSMDKMTYDFEPDLDPWVDSASQFSGTEAHVWIPNYGIVAWKAFWKFLVANPSNYTILDIDENRVVFEHQGKTRSHLFDFDSYGTDFLQALAREDCFKSIYITISMASFVSFKFCAAAYTFDLFLEKPIGNCRESFDIDLPFDQDCPFDSDPVDPFSDGWLGWSLSGRFEQRENQPLALDSWVVPSVAYAGETCVYDGFFTQNLTNTRYDVEMPVTVMVSGEIT